MFVTRSPTRGPEKVVTGEEGEPSREMQVDKESRDDKESREVKESRDDKASGSGKESDAIHEGGNDVIHETPARKGGPVNTAASRGNTRRGRPTNLELLHRATARSHSQGARKPSCFLDDWQKRIHVTSSESERERSTDEKRKREEDLEEVVNPGEHKKSKVKRKTPERERGENLIAKMIKELREEMCGRLDDISRKGDEAKEEVRKLRKNWEEWEKEKEKVWQKLESVENHLRENEERRKTEMIAIEERLSKLEASDEQSRKEIVRSEKVIREGAGAQNEDTNVIKRLTEIERRIEREQFKKRRKNVVIKGVEVKSRTGEEEVRKVINDIGAKVRVERVRRLGRMQEGEKGMFLVTLGSEEDRFEIMGKKRLLKGRSERIEEDMTPQERRKKWMIGQSAWEERRKGHRVIIGRDRIWVNGEMRIWDDEKEVFEVCQARQGRETNRERLSEIRGNAAGFTQDKRT